MTTTADAAAPTPQYEDRYVAFADVMGWREKTKRSAEELEAFSALDRAAGIMAKVEAAARGLEGNAMPQPPVATSQFSDSLVLSCPAGAGMPTSLLSLLMAVTKPLLEDGLYLRGAIVRGPIRHHGTVCYGPALLTAYDLEQHVASYPRLLIHPSARDGVVSIWIRKDVDGLEHFDVFRALEVLIKPTELKGFLSTALAKVNANETQNAGHLRERAKDGWLKGYLSEALSRAPFDYAAYGIEVPQD